MNGIYGVTAAYPGMTHQVLESTLTVASRVSLPGNGIAKSWQSLEGHAQSDIE
ncbi:hypothetical protein [Pseudomonas huanghezhanensis]|uniref:hypothetical protein n=1 Tax=Pseudomonas huanghezhanensis TaxID=3002903 RepID=UPI0022861588|nr:hypothetical protein [Pseudomonas sp. BSw22131]